MVKITRLDDRDAYGWERVSKDRSYRNNESGEVIIYSWDNTGSHVAWAGNWDDYEARIYSNDSEWRTKVRFLSPEDPKDLLEDFEEELDREYKQRINGGDNTYLRPGECIEECNELAKFKVIIGSATMGGVIGGVLGGAPFLPSIVIPAAGICLYEMRNDFYLTEKIEERQHRRIKEDMLEHARSNLYNAQMENNEKFFDNLNGKFTLLGEEKTPKHKAIEVQEEHLFEAEFFQFEDREGLTLDTVTESYEDSVNFVRKTTGQSIEQAEKPSLYSKKPPLLQILGGLDHEWKQIKLATEIFEKASQEIIEHVKYCFPGIVDRARSEQEMS